MSNAVAVSRTQESHEEREKSFLARNKYLILRRTTQLTILSLYIAGNYLGWKILQGNLSTSKFLEVIPLSDPYAVLQMFFAGVVVGTDVLIGALIILTFYSLVAGRAFCSWVCPVNIITDFANWLKVKLGLHREERKVKIPRSARYWFLVLGLVLSPILGVPAFEFISPVSITHRGLIFGMGLGWTIILAIFIFDLLVVKNGWCGHLCPLGAFYSVVSKPASLIRVGYDLNKCTECMECKRVCPEVQVLWMIGKESKPVLSGECTNCGRCIDVCPEHALFYTLRFKKSGGDKDEA
ncbi:MAG: quinol dehydrogenase ferredoxin subunit NapH [Aquificae bacterium]|nr:quinol dehydrogenase ferredoxin subunit NapH [Aquificota bacterium]